MLREQVGIVSMLREQVGIVNMLLSGFVTQMMYYYIVPPYTFLLLCCHYMLPLICVLQYCLRHALVLEEGLICSVARGS